MSAIHLENLVKKFGDFTALQTMNLDIENGEFMALLGPSGCGKSTTMNIIAGMEEPTSGRVLFDEANMGAVPMPKRGVGFVFQNYAIFTHMSVRENLAYGLKMQNLPAAEIDRRVGDIAELLQLGSILDRPSAKLSVNILQRLAIGRSAIMEPKIFLLDEPLSNVDAAFRAVMRTELKHLQREFKQTMVYVTHDQLEAMTMADRIAVMDHGILQQVGAPLEVYNNPVNIFVAKFIGSPGMNLLPATLMAQGEGVVADLGIAGRSASLGPELTTALDTFGNTDIWFGFRPEEVLICGEGEGFVAEVTFVERIGSRTIGHFLVDAEPIKAIFNNDVALRAGEHVRIRPAQEAVRLFDRKSGRAIVGA